MEEIIIIDDDEVMEDGSSLLLDQSNLEMEEIIIIDDDEVMEDAQTPSASSSLPPHHCVLSSYRFKNMNFVSGKTVELHDEDFLRITRILCDQRTNEVFLNGKRLRRTRKLGAYITPRINEVCWIEDRCADGTDKPEKLPIESVTRLRQLRMTNKRHEDINVSHVMESTATVRMVNDEGLLFCRCKFVTIYANQAARKKARTFVEKILRALDLDEVDEQWWDERRSRQMSSVTVIDDGDLQEVEKPPQYTFGDIFCGAGGMSSAAKQAGFKVKFGLELDSTAARTWQKNFAGGVCENTDVCDFVQPTIYDPAEYKVDVLHMSFPCQSFSPMQTCKGKTHDANQVVILSINELIAMIKPRMITIEETFGLLFPDNMEFFKTVVRTLHDQGYSVRWGILKLAHYGTPQERRRLIILASGPTEYLPPFPAPTHLHAPATIASLISSLPLTDPLPAPYRTPRPPYSIHGFLPNLIATNGGANYHPSGTRPFSLREFACLQTFPRDFEFVGTKGAVLRQIGNAVPPLAGRRVLEVVRGCLERRDGW